MRDLLNGAAAATMLLVVVKVLTFYGIHPVVPLDWWCYWAAFVAGSLVCVPLAGPKS
jgi:hypothetical protein